MINTTTLNTNTIIRRICDQSHSDFFNNKNKASSMCQYMVIDQLWESVRDTLI